MVSDVRWFPPRVKADPPKPRMVILRLSQIDAERLRDVLGRMVAISDPSDDIDRDTDGREIDADDAVVSKVFDKLNRSLGAT